MRDERVDATAVVWVGLGWLAVAIAVSAAGLVERLRPPAPPLAVTALTVLTLVAVAIFAPLRRWVMAVDVRALVALHLTRLVAGSYFLVLYAQGAMPYAFAVPGGIGDILVALLALGLLVAVTPASATGRRLYVVWNVLGLIDIVFVVVTAGRIGAQDPGALLVLLQLPLSLLPTFLVPLIIASHLILFRRLARPTGVLRA
jgi:hypothetical protein